MKNTDDQKDREIPGRELFYLEQRHIGELEDESLLAGVSEAEQQRIEAELTEEDARLFEQLPSGRFAAAVAEKAAAAGRTEADNTELPGTRRAGRSPGTAAAFSRWLPLAAAALIALAVGIGGLILPQGEGAPTDVERIKGLEPVINIYRAEEQGVRLLEERSPARRNDLLQLEYNGAGYPYGMILSIDGRGTVTLHYPASLQQNPALEEGRVLLPYAYQLDDAPGFERFIFVASQRSFAPRQVLQAARRLAEKGHGGRRGELGLPDDFFQTSMMILKEK
jgi:hypothetical protein